MPRAGKAPLTRTDLIILIKEHLEQAGARGLSKADLLDAIGPTRTSAVSIQRALDDLRSQHDAQVRYDGRTRRWYLDAPLPLPLDAPTANDVLAVLLAQAILAPFADAQLRSHLAKLVEDLDARVRARGQTPASELPPRKAMTSTITLGTKFDADILRRLLVACRRRALRIKHASPWQIEPTPPTWNTIEPWALDLHDGAFYVRAYAHAQQEPRTFRVADIDAAEELDEQPRSRHTPPENLWGEDGFGIDLDRPCTAVIRMRGPVARWASRVQWHPSEDDNWLDDGKTFERTLKIRSCREFARRLVSHLDGLESVEPRELRDEVVALAAHAMRL